MIVSRIEGGLGNQMFQYAAGLALAERLGTQLLLDLAPLETASPKRPFALHHFRLTPHLVTDDHRARFPSRFGGPSFWRRWTQRGAAGLRLVRERGIPFQPDLLSARDESYLAGYWQCERYFSEIREQLLQAFEVRHPLAGKNADLARQLQQSHSVAVHVRRGDYVGNPNTYRIHGVCDEAYYRRAVDALGRCVGPLSLFIFSDDVPWCRENLSWSQPAVYVDHNDDAHPYEDLRLMTFASHFIIANSSFSWWGAWLARNPEKIVCAPSRWFRAPHLDDRDLVPHSWQRIAAA